MFLVTCGDYKTF